MHSALLVVGHGSRDPEGVSEFLQLGRILTERRRGQPTALAFLEFAEPTIEQSIEQLARTGARRIVCQPGMLFTSGHVKRDLPLKLQDAKRQWPDLEFTLSSALEMHDKLLDLCQLRWNEALQEHPVRDSKHTMLLLAGRGSSDPDANATFVRIAQRLGDRYGVGEAVACYSGLSSPVIGSVLEEAAQSDFTRIIVQPYFLFTGILVKQIQALTDDVSRRHKHKEIFSTPHLAAHPLAADVFEERAEAFICSGRQIHPGR